MPKQTLEIEGRDVKVGDVITEYRYPKYPEWHQVNTLRTVVSVSDADQKIWVGEGKDLLWWGFDRTYKVERETQGETIEVRGDQLQIGDVIAEWSGVTGGDWYTTAARVEEKNRDWTLRTEDKHYMYLVDGGLFSRASNRKYRVIRKAPTPVTRLLEVNGKNLRIGDVMVSYFLYKGGWQPLDSNRDGTIVKKENNHMILEDGGAFDTRESSKYKIKRPVAPEDQFAPCQPLGPSNQQLVQSAQMKMHYRDNGRVHCPNGEPIKFTLEERAAWKEELRNKTKAAEEKERNRVQVDLEYEPWE